MCFALCLLPVLVHAHYVERLVLPMSVVLQPHSLECPAAELLRTCARPALGRDRGLRSPKMEPPRSRPEPPRSRPGAARSRQEPPGAARSRQEQRFCVGVVQI